MSSKKDLIKRILDKKLIYHSDLKRLQVLKDCSNWNGVKPLGLVTFKSDFHHYDGGIIEFQSNPYYISKKQINALMKFVSWQFKKVIKVVEKK